MDYTPEIQMTKNMLTCVEYVLFFSFSSAVVIILENINITESVYSLVFKIHSTLPMLVLLVISKP